MAVTVDDFRFWAKGEIRKELVKTIKERDAWKQRALNAEETLAQVNTSLDAARRKRGES